MHPEAALLPVPVADCVFSYSPVPFCWLHQQLPVEHLRLLQDGPGFHAALQAHRPAAPQQEVQPGARLRQLSLEQTGDDRLDLPAVTSQRSLITWVTQFKWNDVKKLDQRAFFYKRSFKLLTNKLIERISFIPLQILYKCFWAAITAPKRLSSVVTRVRA